MATNKEEWKYDPFSYKDWSYDDFTYDDYVTSNDVNTAKAKSTLAANAVQSYADFNYANQSKLNDVLKQYLNRKDFSYDFNSDALYQQYRDKYIKQGKLAMADTIGQAAAMTGGYGNSYAVSAGNQAYQASLENLNDIVPELYAMALERYNQQGQDIANKYSMLSDDRNAAYSQWQDGYNRLVSDRDYYANRYDSERQWDYGLYSDQRDFAYNQYSSDRSLDYDKYSSDRNLAYDEYSDDKTMSYQQYRDDIADAQWEKEHQLKASTTTTTKKEDEKEEPASITPTKSEATSAFIGKHMSLSEWVKHGGATSAYYMKIRQGIKNIEDELTDEEIAYLVSYYGLTE